MANLFSTPKPYLRSVQAAVFCAVVCFLPSCSEQSPDPPDGGRQIVFSATLGDYTRAASTFGPLDLTTLRTSADGFAVSTRGLGSGGEMNNVVVRYNAGLWGYTGSYFWPLSASENVRFTAYAPAGTIGAALTSAGLTVSAFTPAAAPASQIDLVYAPPTDFSRTGSGRAGVILPFKHLLTQVVIRLEPVLPLVGSILITNVQLSVPRNRGSYDGTTWTSAPNPQTYTFFTGGINPLISHQSAPLLLVPTGTIPQNTYLTINYSLVLFNYSRQVDLSTLTDVTTWSAGSKITYTMTVLLPLREGETRSLEPAIEVTATQEEGY